MGGWNSTSTVFKKGVAYVGGWSSTSPMVCKNVGGWRSTSPTDSKKVWLMWVGGAPLVLWSVRMWGWSSSAVSKSAFVVAFLGIVTIKREATNADTRLSLSLFPFLIPEVSNHY